MDSARAGAAWPGAPVDRQRRLCRPPPIRRDPPAAPRREPQGLGAGLKKGSSGCKPPGSSPCPSSLTSRTFLVVVVGVLYRRRRRRRGRPWLLRRGRVHSRRGGGMDADGSGSPYAPGPARPPGPAPRGPQDGRTPTVRRGAPRPSRSPPLGQGRLAPSGQRGPSTPGPVSALELEPGSRPRRGPLSPRAPEPRRRTFVSRPFSFRPGPESCGSGAREQNPEETRTERGG